MSEFKVRQDRITWASPGRGWVRWTDPDGTFHREFLNDVQVWAYVSSRSLLKQLDHVLADTGPHILAHALRRLAMEWTREEAIEWLAACEADVGRLERVEIDGLPKHGFVFNPKGPQAEAYITVPGDDCGCETHVLASAAKSLTMVANTFGGSLGPAKRIEEKLDPESLATFYASLRFDIASLLDLLRAEEPTGHDWMVEEMLPESRRGECAGCGKPFARTRSNTEYGSSACRQVALRRRRRAAA